MGASPNIGWGLGTPARLAWLSTQCFIVAAWTVAINRWAVSGDMLVLLRVRASVGSPARRWGRTFDFPHFRLPVAGFVSNCGSPPWNERMRVRCVCRSCGDRDVLHHFAPCFCHWPLGSSTLKT